MPTENTAWGIEIGQCALKAIRLRHDPATDTVEALAFDYIEHPKILSQPDADPDALAREALQTFLSRNVVKGEHVCVGVPGQSGLARFIKLPPVEQSRIPEIVKYEARQQIPFALEEVVWDFQTIGKAEETEGFALETEIGLFAMKRDLIYRFLNPFREAGVEVDAVQMRPLAVYNFAAFDQITADGKGSAEAEVEEEEEEKEESEYQREELVERKKAPAPADDGNGFVVLLDIGADNSDLVITDGTRIWQRSLPLGGNHFTRALTKELKLTFAKAEHLKRNATKAQDPRAVFQAMRPVFNDLVGEIQRSVGYFASVHRQSKITRILGMGNAFKLPGLQKFLAQNLQYEVDKVEGLKRVKGDAVLSAPAFQENLPSFTVACGLALQALGVSDVRTNLLPPEISQARMIRRKKPWVLTAASILMGAFTCLFFGSFAQLNAVNSPDFDPANKKAKAEMDYRSGQETKFNTAKGNWQSVKTNGETLTGNVDKRLEWIEVYAAINRALPVNPEGIHPQDLKNHTRLVITRITPKWHDDVKAEWFDKVTAKKPSWADSTVLPLDKSSPPSGPGWVFTVEGFHFNTGRQTYTPKAALDAPRPARGAGAADGAGDKPEPDREDFRGLHSAGVRYQGIRGAVLTKNDLNMNFVPTPGSDELTGGKRSGGERGSSKSSRSGGGGAGMGGGGGGMGMGMGGAGKDDGAADSPNRGSRGSTGDQPGSGAGTDSSKPAAGKAQFQTVPKTDFVIEFVWQPDKARQKKWSDVLQEVRDAPGRPTITISSKELEQLEKAAEKERAEAAAAEAKKDTKKPESGATTQPQGGQTPGPTEKAAPPTASPPAGPTTGQTPPSK